MSNDKSAAEIVQWMLGLAFAQGLAYLLIESQAAEIAELRAKLPGAGANSLIQAHIIEHQRNPLDADKIVRLTMENATLRSQLAASQQREKSAV